MEQQYKPQLERYLGLLDRSSSLKKNIDRLSDQYTSLTTFDTMRTSPRVVPEQGALVVSKNANITDGNPTHLKSQIKPKSNQLERRNTQLQYQQKLHQQQKDTTNKKGHVSLPLMNKKTPQEVHFSQLQRALSSATVGNKAIAANPTTSVFPVASMSTSFRIPERSASTIRSSRNSLRFSHKDSMDILNAHLYKDQQGRWNTDSLKEKSFFGPKAPQYPLLSSVYKNVPSTATSKTIQLNGNTPPSPRPIHPSIGMYDLPINQLAMPLTPDTSPQSSVRSAVSMTLSNTSIPEEGPVGSVPTQKKTKGLKGFLTRNLPGRNNKLFGILNGSPEAPPGQRERAK
ncbi:hypothetical protein J3Q64DRAFT_1693938 [Phycomyces blakesleeanus]|uniref:Uncharacterized protein n=2 Tax=Phycomyces blakesleeanus TaxID=4837 RepID=A0A163EL96_PHYB8|nr:hypothetical protein PHYBLDRAFT_162336 [Phycomyces blakesleeanus NRRL 1555(-)]OAD79260.1 hypothetical protein PHYBLDRAFT_162336 [Phycomyces blakesleeanus NRRL 1555(-)]|eukprot:XP_018297300.1 hypothetical protein PHYBLDRAFT_162336 [Phycomyces blakesleeanus NRRL 1555(-)]